MKPHTIAYITETATDDKHAWSGTAHYVYEALLRHGYKVNALGPARPGLLRFVMASANKISLMLFKKRIDYRHSKIYSRAFGSIFTAKLKRTAHDLIVVCGGTEYGAYLKTDKPVYYVLDRTIAGALNYHTILKDLWKFSQEQSIATDRRAMLTATKIFFSSEWAAEHARKYYGIPEKRIAVLPFGANLDRIPTNEESLRGDIGKECRLLLVGTYWMNKGADIAYRALQILRKKNLNVTLTVVGCTPPEPINDPALVVIPFIDKNTNEGMRQMWALFMRHHFFILPTRFDCTPIVYCEAAAFGLPVLSADTGGVRGHLTEGVNGFLIPSEDKGEGYAAKISELLHDPAAYAALCRTSREQYDRALNWDRWAGEFSRLLDDRAA